MSAVTAPLRRARPVRPSGQPRLEVVAPPVVRHTLLFALLIVAVLGAAVFGAVTLNALAAGAAVEARALETEVAESERVYAQLVADVATLEDPARIRETALELGLVPSGPARFVTLDRNLPADGAVAPTERPGATTDPLKPLLSQER